ncbi:MAG: hypothetical protein M1505_00620 [Patescibacteria group bacterium]|nr:hypothetical protein [Patescibacteria group bacterium]
MSKFLLLLGPSGVGKNSIIDELIRLDSRFVYISPFMTRPLRKGERNKISVSGGEMDEMLERGEFLVINELYGVRYATPRQPIEQALKEGNFPVLDWPIGRVSVMTEAFPDQLYIVYISPPSIEALQRRLARDDRDTNGHRLRSAREELEVLESSRHAGIYDFEIVSEENQVPKVAQTIYASYLQQFFRQQP